MLYKHHKERAYILVDEYDKPVNHLLEANNRDNKSYGKNYQIHIKDDVQSVVKVTNTYRRSS
ncbi:MAG: AAA family ATPase [Candidatus Midichloria mitochondrii]|nr:AAA family ATPase [Candidatus Midichloria mitochondrii]